MADKTAIMIQSLSPTWFLQRVISFCLIQTDGHLQRCVAPLPDCFKNQLINLASVSVDPNQDEWRRGQIICITSGACFFPPLRKKIDCYSSELTLNVELLLGDCTLSDTASGRDAIWNRDGRGCWLYSSKFSLGGLKPREMCFGQHTIRCYTFPFGFATASGFVSLNLSTPVAPSLSPLQKISFLPFLICHVYEPFPTPVGSCG